MRVIVQTVEHAVIYRSYEIEADSVGDAQRADRKGLRPQGERRVVTSSERATGAAQRAYLVQTHRLNDYLDCKDDDW